jgi:transposase
VDESGFRPLPAVVRSYAPRGQTPILREWLTWDHLSAIGAITPSGALYMAVQDRAFKSPDVVCFLEQLLSQTPGKLLVVWDGLPTHRSQVIKDFLAAGAAKRLWLERLPAYAPELNPTEGIWQYLKRVEMRNLVCHSLDHLQGELEASVERLRLKPDVIHGCIRQPGCYFSRL